MPTPKLQPCPFCGNDNVEFSYEDIDGSCGRVMCWKCFASGPCGSDKVDAHDAWNRRASVTQDVPCRYSDGAGGCRTSPLVPPSFTPCEHADNPSRCKLYKAEGSQP